MHAITCAEILHALHFGTLMYIGYRVFIELTEFRDAWKLHI